MPQAEKRSDVIKDGVSVVIPTWNRRGELKTAIQSVLAQTYPPCEVFVCDDGSTDGSEQVVKELDDHRIVWLPGQHAGHPGPPRNRGIRASSGEWVSFLDDDDVWLPDKLEKQLIALKRSGHQACCTNAWHDTPSEPPVVYHGTSNCAYTLRDLLNENRVVCSSAVVHRTILTTTEGFPEDPDIIYEDYALWLRVVCLTNFEYLGEPLVRYMDDPATSARRHSAKLNQRSVIVRDTTRWLTRHRSHDTKSATRIMRGELTKEVLSGLKTKFSRLTRRF